MCMRAEGVVLPSRGYFGVSAATGGLADDHDVFQFLTSSLYQPGQMTDLNNLPEESDKLAKEYQEYQDKLKKQEDEYRKEHPDQKKEPEVEDWFETDNARELRQIWQSQTHVIDNIKELSRKMDEMIGRQERTMGLLSINAQQQGGQQQQIPHQAGAGLPAVAPQFDTIRRHEVEAIIQNQNQFIQAVREIKSTVVELQARADTILQNQGRQPHGHIQQAGYDVQSMITEMRDGLNQIKSGITNVHAK